jgi:hypothetical protein
MCFFLIWPKFLIFHIMQTSSCKSHLTASHYCCLCSGGGHLLSSHSIIVLHPWTSTVFIHFNEAMNLFLINKLYTCH